MDLYELFSILADNF